MTLLDDFKHTDTLTRDKLQDKLSNLEKELSDNQDSAAKENTSILLAYTQRVLEIKNLKLKALW